MVLQPLLQPLARHPWDQGNAAGGGHAPGHTRHSFLKGRDKTAAEQQPGILMVKTNEMQRPKYLLPARLRSPAPPQNQHPPVAQGSPQALRGPLRMRVPQEELLATSLPRVARRASCLLASLSGCTGTKNNIENIDSAEVTLMSLKTGMRKVMAALQQLWDLHSMTNIRIFCKKHCSSALILQLTCIQLVSKHLCPTRGCESPW